MVCYVQLFVLMKLFGLITSILVLLVLTHAIEMAPKGSKTSKASAEKELDNVINSIVATSQESRDATVAAEISFVVDQLRTNDKLRQTAFGVVQEMLCWNICLGAFYWSSWAWVPNFRITGGGGAVLCTSTVIVSCVVLSLCTDAG